MPSVTVWIAGWVGGHRQYVICLLVHCLLFTLDVYVSKFKDCSSLSRLFFGHQTNFSWIHQSHGFHASQLFVCGFVISKNINPRDSTWLTSWRVEDGGVTSVRPLNCANWTHSPVSQLFLYRFVIGQYVPTHGDVISHVNITSVRVEDGGNYKCTASNRVGEASHSAELHIYGNWILRVMSVTTNQLIMKPRELAVFDRKINAFRRRPSLK